MAAVYVLLGRQAEAETEANRALDINPNFSIKRVSKAWPYKNQDDLKLLTNALRMAGLPE